MTDSDYVTILPAVKHDRWLVAIMHALGNDEYTIWRLSQTPVKRTTAEALAKSWAAASNLEVRM